MGHVHEGHRARLRERLAKEGMDHFQPHEVVELLLFQSIPVRNVNQLAHELVNRFGSVSGVLKATKAELATVPGVGEATADWLSSLKPILDEYMKCRLADRPRLIKCSATATYAKQIIPESPDEQFWMMSLTRAGHLLACSQIAMEDGVRKPDACEMARFLLRYRTQTAVIVQRRTSADMEPDERDRTMIKQMQTLLSPLRIDLMDILFICGHRHVSLHKLGLVQPRRPFGILKEYPDDDWGEHWLDE